MKKMEKMIFANNRLLFSICHGNICPNTWCAHDVCRVRVRVFRSISSHIHIVVMPFSLINIESNVLLT